ncbi:MAG: GPR endopeptidase [Clostridia bacterium]|nr:GPR endopeptidase [Clostridia bacterium]
MENSAILTDMAVEFYKHSHSSDDGLIKFYEVQVDAGMARKLGKPVGRYSTLETPAVLGGDTDSFDAVSERLCECLLGYCGKAGCTLVAGLGNPDLTADALGSRVFKRLNVNRHLRKDRCLCALTPNVLGMTGIESFDIIYAVTKRIKPDIVIAVDALTAAASSRIASAFQVTDSGITPGSGVMNHRMRLDMNSLGVPVVSVGVPLVVYASTIAGECLVGHDMVVTPKDIDILVEDCARIIANAINAMIEI